MTNHQIEPPQPNFRKDTYTALGVFAVVLVVLIGMWMIGMPPDVAPAP
jgi:hypothetical protein